MTTIPMGTLKQLDHSLFRILLYRNDASEILLETAPEGFRLPILSVPAHRREAEEITGAIRTSWDLETYGLFRLLPAVPSHPRVHDYLLEACQPDRASPAHMEWRSAGSLSVGAFQTPSDLAAIQTALQKLDQYRRDELPGTFGKPGWLRMVTKWVEDQAARADLTLTGAFRQFNACPTFSLLRFETDGPALWFKAVGEPNLHEHHVTMKLASLFPEFLPRILASRPEWNAWLVFEPAGAPLHASSETSAWKSAAENLALLQISSFGRGFELIDAAGCKDLRPCSLLRMVDPFLDFVTELMERQTKLCPPRLSPQELRSLRCEITSALEELAECEIPDTLGHLDINPGNILVCGGTSCVFLDWAEAYVGPPFFSFQYLLEHARRSHGADSHFEYSLQSSYATPWGHFASPTEVARTLRLVPLLAAFAYAAGGLNWRNRDSLPHTFEAHLRSLTRRMNREADILRQRRLPCVP